MDHVGAVWQDASCDQITFASSVIELLLVQVSTLVVDELGHGLLRSSRGEAPHEIQLLYFAEVSFLVSCNNVTATA